VFNAYSGAISLGRDVQLSAGNTSTRTTFSGGISGAGGITVAQGRVTFEGTAKTYAGPTTVNSGAILQLTGGELLPDAGAVTVNGNLRFAGGGTTTETIGGLSGGGTVEGSTVAGTYGLVVSQATDTTFTGTIINGQANTVISLTKAGIGRLTLSGANTYTGSTTVSGGVLQLNAATALPGGIGAAGGTSGLTIAGGVVGLGASDFSRGLGTTAAQVQWTGSGGFAAYGAARSVNLGGAAAEVTWGGGSFVPDDSALMLGAADADGTIDFRNPINLGGASRTVQVVGGRAVMSGALQGAGGGLTKTGSGVLTLTASNSYTAGTTVSEGVLGFASQASIPGWGAAGAVSVAAGASLAVGNDVDPQTAIDLDYLDPASGLGFDTSAGDRTWGTPLSGGRSFVKTGGNALTLTAAGAGAVPTTIYAGVLTLGVAETAGISGPLGTSGTITFAGGTLRYSAANQHDYSARFSNAAGQPFMIDTAGQNVTYATGLGGEGGSLTKTGTGRLTLTGASTYSGATTVSGGTLTIGTGGSLAATTTVALANTAGAAFELNGASPTIAGLTGGGASGGNLVLTSGTLTVNKASGSDTFSGAVSGAGALVKTGAGTLRLAGGSNFSGGMTISAGSLELNAATAAGGGSITINDAGTGASNTSLFISANSSVTVANPIVVTAQGSGIVSIGGQSTLNTAVNLYSGSITLGRDVQLSAGSTPSRTTFSGGMTGAGGVTVTQGRVTYESTAKTYAGPTTVNSGAVLQLTGGELLPNTTPLTVDGALWFTSGGTSTTTVGSLAGTGSVRGHPDVAGTYGFIVSQSTDTTFSGTIINGRVNSVVSLTKAGIGGLTLTGANTFTGATTVSAGTLLVNGSIAPSSLTTVQSGATLGGTGTVGATRIEAGGFHAPGASPGIQTVTNGLQYDAGSTLTWELFVNSTAGRGTAYDGIDLTGGALAIDPAAILALDFGTSAGGSLVDWDDAFWGSDQSWTIIDVSDAGTWDGGLFGLISVGTDTLSRSLASVRPQAAFSLADVDGDLTLRYVAVPEPAALPLAGLAAAAALGLARWRWFRRQVS
jgi:fibronectin-binding autotransporter adhesin